MGAVFRFYFIFLLGFGPPLFYMASRNPLRPEELAEAVFLYGTGLTIAKLAERFGRSRAGMHLALRRAGVKCRPRGGAHNTKPWGKGHAPHPAAKERRFYVDGVPRVFADLSAAARGLGVSKTQVYNLLRTGRLHTFESTKFREHPGLDCMPDPLEIWRRLNRGG
uniref:helix-turn-helix domain-containing protein n=1 Tax=Alistipes sp. TaxID=1872444 RepID=UPI00405746B1